MVHGVKSVMVAPSYTLHVACLTLLLPTTTDNQQVSHLFLKMSVDSLFLILFKIVFIEGVTRRDNQLHWTYYFLFFCLDKGPFIG